MPKSKHPKIIGIVLAGGYGKRLFGPTGGSKGLFVVGQLPLIEYSLSTLRNAKIEELVIVARNDDPELHSKYSDHSIISNVAEGTLSAVLAAAQYAVEKEASAVISSCDLVCALSTSTKLMRALETNSRWDASIGVTTIANDHTPIWVCADDRGQVLDYGKEIPPSNVAFASIRFASLRFLKLMLEVSKTVSSEIDTDTKLMRHMIVNKLAVVGAVNIGPALDVDNALDVEVATGITLAWEKPDK